MTDVVRESREQFSAMSDLLNIMTTGHPFGPANLYLMVSLEPLIATGLIPASAFPNADTFREGTLPNGVEFPME